MRRLLLLLIVAISSFVHAQDPNLQRGFAPGKAYDFLGIDSVSLMNGNLNVRIPIGQQYSVGPALQYQFMLAYNSKVWEIEYAGPGQDPLLPQSWAVPETRSNAGFGWQLTLGTLLPPKVHSVHGPQQGWTYLAPDGSEHEFPTVDDVSVAYSEDGSYLRLRRLPDITGRVGYHEIDFPDGIIRQFDGAHNLTEIRDRYGYKVKVVRTTTQWTVTEEGPGGAAGRTHTILFENALNSDGLPYGQENFRMRPVDVNLAAFGASTNVANYHLDYTDTKVEVGPCADALTNSEWYVPHLDSITFPDQSAFSMTYLTTPVDRCTQATLNVMTLPTAGKIRWNFGSYELTNQACIKPRAGVLEDGWRKVHAGVRLRTLETETGTIVEKRTYTPDLPIRLPLVNQRCGGGTEMWLLEKPPDLFKNTVTVSVPSGTSSEGVVEKTTSYFSAYPAEVDGTMTGGALVSPALGSEYGLPLARGTYVGDTESTKRFLSSRVYACDGGTTCSDTVVRTTYLKYALEESVGVSGSTKAKNPRVEAQRTVFEDDSCGGNCRYYTDSASTNWDGYGHYRQSVVTSNIPDTPEKTTFRNYTPDATNWLLELYDDAWAKEGTGSTATGSRGQATFDSVTGAMISQRTYKATGADPSTFSQNANDLLTAWCRDANHGFVTSERYFGGDLAGVPSGNPCTATRGLGHYFINHAYTFSGAILATHTAQYDGTSHLIADETFDANTGLVRTSRDSAGVETGFTYDASGRLTAVKPAAEASTTYAYQLTSNPLALIVRRCSPGLEQCPTGSLMETRYYYDDLGRMVEERQKMPPSSTQTPQWSALWTTYGPLGRTMTKTVAVTATSGDSGSNPAAPATSWDYDFLGRVFKETRPDDSETGIEYAGVRRKTRTSRIWTGVDGDAQTSGIQDTPVSVIEEYDGHGRLLTVTENSGPTGGVVTTSHRYDVGDRLTSVKMTGTEGAVQNRFFDYDGRGFLRWESHPESGMTSYTYDARGHVASKNQSAAKTPFDLKYTYDSAERLIKTEGRDPANTDVYRPIKVFAFATDNDFTVEPDDYRKGKLLTATRYNYPGSMRPNEPTLRVVETYSYQNAAGRPTDRKTEIIDDDNPGAYPSVTQKMSYNDLGLPATIEHPICEDCGLPAGDPKRPITYSYTHGRLTSLSNFVSGITYWPNGMRRDVARTNSTMDKQTVDPSGMARPGSLWSGNYGTCARPTIVQQSAGGVVSSTNPSVTLSVTAGGTGPFTYAWYKSGLLIAGETSSTLMNVHPTSTTTYYVEVSNECGQTSSAVMKVEVGECVTPWIASKSATRNANGTFTLTATAAGAEPFTYQWYRLSDNSPVGTGATVQTAVLSVTTEFQIRVTNSCGTGTADVTASAPLPSPTGLVAQLTGTNQITVTWNASAGAVTYDVHRRTAGLPWQVRATGIGPTTQFVDGGLSTNTTYAYWVVARLDEYTASTPSNVDLATTMAFTPVQAGDPVNVAVFNELLAALNAVRSAAGWAAVGWSNILAANDPLPNLDQPITSKHILALRARLNEALQALGVSIGGYADPDLSVAAVSAQHITDLQNKAR